MVIPRSRLSREPADPVDLPRAASHRSCPHRPPSLSPPMRRRILLSLCVPGAVFAQASQGHVDYAKADLIRTAGAFVLNSAVAPTWFQDSTRFYYRSASPSGISTVYVVDPAKRTRTQMFDNVRLASAMSLAGDTIIDASRLPNFRLTD